MSHAIEIVADAGAIPAIIRWLIERIDQLERLLRLSEDLQYRHETRIQVSQLKELLKRLLELRPDLATAQTKVLARFSIYLTRQLSM